VYPAARNLVGSQQVPYIYDDRVNNDQQVADALEKVFKMGRTARKKLGLEAREWARRSSAWTRCSKGWDERPDKAMERHRSPAVVKWGTSASRPSEERNVRSSKP
jgi:hypothetical protein